MPVDLELTLRRTNRPVANNGVRQMRPMSRLQWRLSHFKKSDRETRNEIVKRDLFKVMKLAFWPLLFLLAILLRIALRTLKPWIHIRFGRLWSFSVGLFAIVTEVYLCERDAGMHPPRSLDLFYHYHRFAFEVRPTARSKARISNQELDRMWRRQLHIWEPARLLYSLNQILPHGSEDFMIKLSEPFDQHGIYDRFSPHLQFTSEEEERGRHALRQMGVEPGTAFVCFHARDDAYTDRALPRITSLYGERFRDVRNASIYTCLPAVEKLTTLGVYAIRMGKYVREPLEVKNPKIIDYATRFHSDFMDLYLSARCSFFIGTNSGIIGLPAVFRRPIAFVNLAPLQEVYNVTFKGSLFIPKSYYSALKGRVLNFCEVFSNRLLRNGLALKPEIYEGQGIQPIENTPDEIAEFAIEMHERLQPDFQPSEENEELQQHFFSILRAHSNAIVPAKNFHRIRIGTSFLRKHQELLDGCEHVSVTHGV